MPESIPEFDWSLIGRTIPKPLIKHDLATKGGPWGGILASEGFVFSEHMWVEDLILKNSQASNLKPRNSKLDLNPEP